MKKGKSAPSGIRRSKAAPLPPVEPEDITIKKARNLPMFGPGIVITVPLNLLPAYIQLYGLDVLTRGDVRDREQQLGVLKQPGMLWVKRKPKAAPNTTESEHG